MVNGDTKLFGDKRRIRARSILLSERIDLGLVDLSTRIAASPAVIRAGEEGCAVLFKYGAVVLFGMQPIEEAAFIADLKKLVRDVHARLYEEQVEIAIDPGTDERVSQGVVVFREAGMDRIQLLADVLAESVVLEYYEDIITATFDRVEPLASSLERGGRVAKRSRELLSHIGAALSIEQRMVGRIEVAEKPDVLWDHVELEPLYARLATEYELRERQVALERKLKLISRTVETVLDLLQHRRSLRVEWYIVILIMVEILLTLYEMFLRH
ncbi:MAG: hypothetical protein AMXMBFR4_17690 [Candidatus Hydrogenedentota bacterium]